MASKYPEHMSPAKWKATIGRALRSLDAAERALGSIHDDDQPVSDDGAVIQQWLAAVVDALERYRNA